MGTARGARNADLGRASAQDVAEAFPEAVALAKRYRELFGDGVRLVYARNSAGLEIGRQPRAEYSVIATGYVSKNQHFLTNVKGSGRHK